MEGRTRLDAGTWGTMGVGLGYAVAAATARPERLVVAVEGDSAFGFSGMECETIARCAPPNILFMCPFSIANTAQQLALLCSAAALRCVPACLGREV